MKNNNYGYTNTSLISFAFIVFIVLLILLPIIYLFGFPNGIVEHYSEGSRSGIITKMSYKGIFFKSYEAEMNMGGLRKKKDDKGRESYIANVFEFSVSKQAIKEIQSALDSGEGVKVTYNQYLVKPIGISSRYVVTKVEIVK